VLKGYSSESLSRTNGLDHVLSDEQVRVASRNDRRIARRNIRRTIQPCFGKSGFTPYWANGDGNGLPEHHVWLAVFTLNLEGFDVSAVWLHPGAAFPYKDFPVQEKTVPKGSLLSPERPESASLVSGTAIPTAIEHEPNLPTEDIGTFFDYVPALNSRRSGYRDALTSLWDAVAIRWKLWRREREIQKTVASLAELDD
jgi:hypothetical protein